MRDSGKYYTQGFSSLTSVKRMGSYLVEAGLLTADQINVALNDQQSTGMRFGEIIVARGWLKEQTVEWVMAKVVEPERQQKERQQKQSEQAVRAAEPATSPIASTVRSAHGLARPGVKVASEKPLTSTPASKTPPRREAPISKPLPSVGSSDGDVNWVG